MADVTPVNVPAAFELRSAALTLLALVLRTPELAALAQDLEHRAGESPGLFDDDPVALDLSLLREHAAALDFAALIALLRRHRLLPLAVRGGNPQQMAAARAAGLAEAPDGAPAAPLPRSGAPATQAVAEVAATAEPAVPTAATAAALPSPSRTLVIDRPLRSGQQVYARGSHLVVLAAVNFGAELIADGSIHVYAPLRGRAVAGARGDTDARIFSTCMEPQLVSIAGTYRTLESALPADVQGRPAQVRLDGDRLVVEALKS
jgi:septum site-determining protein MinC